MTRLRRAILAACLGASLFVLNVWLPVQVAGHAPQHSHHSSATHADPLCTLLCSVGHAAHEVALVVWSDQASTDRVDPGRYRSPATDRSNVPLSRGPPALLRPIPTIPV